MNNSTDDLPGKVRAALPLFLNRGKVYLYALFERSDMRGKWDFLLSTSGTDVSAEQEIKFFAAEVVQKLTPVELGSLSRMMPIKSTDPALLGLTSALHVENGESRITNSNFNGLYVMNALIFRAVLPQAKAVHEF